MNEQQNCGHCGHSIYSHDTTGVCSYCAMMLRGRGVGVSLPKVECGSERCVRERRGD